MTPPGILQIEQATLTAVPAPILAFDGPFVLRRILNPMGTQDSMEFLLDKLKYSKTNQDFFDAMNT